MTAVAQFDEIEPKTRSCGTTRRAFVDEPGWVASLHLLQVSEAVTHYHRKAIEIYLVLEFFADDR